jgi:cytochrome c oxidase subunit 4
MKTVLLTGLALLALWGASWGLSYVDLGRASLVIAIAIAAAKAVLVALFFMELVKESFSIRATIATACTLATLLLGLMVADVLTRDPGPLAVPGAEAPLGPAKLPSR